MIKKFLSIMSLSLICAFSITQLQAQDDKSKTKVIIIEKSIDKDGNVEMSKKMKSGKEAEAYINEIELNGDLDNIEVKKKSHYKIVKKDENGDVEVIEWSGSGEMPEEIRKWAEDGKTHDIDFHSKKHVQIRVEKDGVKKEVTVEVEGEDVEDMTIFGDEIEFEVMDSNDSRKAQLGVMVELTDEAKGAKVIDIVKNSAAEKAGIKTGDIITKVGESAVTSPEELVDSIKDREPGDEVIITFMRNNQSYVIKVPLQKLEMWKEVESNADVEEIIIIKKKK